MINAALIETPSYFRVAEDLLTTIFLYREVSNDISRCGAEAIRRATRGARAREVEDPKGLGRKEVLAKGFRRELP